MCALLAGSSGLGFLIYQLRRYRNDDYRGQYRLWRMVLVLLLIGSIHSLTGLVSWGGALVDAAFGKRVALTGSDWMRLIVSIGAAILALRLIAEVRRSRWALTWLLMATGLFAIPEAANWNVLTVETLGAWSTLVTAAPLLAVTALFLSLTGYLRMLYREVKRIEDDSLMDRFHDFRSRLFQRRQVEDYEDEEDVDEEPARPRRRWFGFGSRRGPSEEEYESGGDEFAAEDETAEDEYEYEYEDEEEYEEEYEDEAAAEEDAELEEEPEPDLSPRKKRRWFGLRAAKREPEEEVAEEADAEEAAEQTPKKRRRWGLRLNPGRQAEPQQEQEPEEEVAQEEEAEEKPKRRFGLSWRKKPAAQEETDNDAAEADPQQAAAATDDEDFIDPEEIDWDSLSKSERRRLRKKLKRQRRAA